MGLPPSPLTVHEEEVLEMLDKGFMKKEIAEKYGLSPTAVTTWLRGHHPEYIKHHKYPRTRDYIPMEEVRRRVRDSFGL